MNTDDEKRDVDEIIKRVRLRHPSVAFSQLQVKHNADDDGLWMFRIRGNEKEIQIESCDGNCPFLVEHDEMATTNEAVEAKTVDQVVNEVVSFLDREQRENG